MTSPDEDTAIYTAAQQFSDTFFSDQTVSPSITFGAASHVGHVRSRNEDHFAVFRMRRSSEALLTSLQLNQDQLPHDASHLMVVADGMGGMKSGEYASRLAVETVLQLAGQASSWIMKLTDTAAQRVPERVQAYVEGIQSALQARSDGDASCTDMGTTWTSAYLLGAHAVIVHLGDSRAYHYHDGKLQQVTRDETVAQQLIEAGMQLEDVYNFRHVLTNHFGGGGRAVNANIIELDLQVSDRLLICSDGLTDMVADDVIAKQLETHDDPQAACDALVKLALENGGRDNVTVTLAAMADADPESS